MALGKVRVKVMVWVKVGIRVEVWVHVRANYQVPLRLQSALA